MAYVTSVSLFKVAGWIMCLFFARSLAQFENYFGDEDESGDIGNITLIPAQYDYQQNYGDTIGNITCAAECPDCTYQWTRDRDDFVVSETEELDIGQLGIWNSGNYTCTVTLDDSGSNITDSISFAVSVNDIRTITDFHLNTNISILVIPLGSKIPSVTAYATFTPANVPCTISWLKGSRVIKSGSVLDLGNMTYSNAGRYLARASIGFEEDAPITRDIPWIITDTSCNNGTPPCVLNTRLHPPNNTYTGAFGDSIPDVECRADCYPFCVFDWRRVSDGAVVSRGATIQFSNLTRDDFNAYQCYATASMGKSNSTDFRQKILLLYTGPTNVTPITMSPNITTLVTAIGRPLEPVTCSAECVPFDCVFSWTNLATGENRRSPVLNDLIPGNMVYEYIGYYVCTAYMMHTLMNTSASHTFVVTDVECEKPCSKNPRFVPPQKEYQLDIGGSAPTTIRCRADCNPPCQFEWRKPNKQIISSNATLVLRNLQQSDFGIYKCFAYTNDSVVSTYELTITRTPDTPSDSSNVGVIVGSVLGGVAGIAFIVGIIMFIRYRKRTQHDEYNLLVIKDDTDVKS